MRIAIVERYVDDNEIVDMIEIFAETISSDIGMNSTDHEISCCADPNLICNMAW